MEGNGGYGPTYTISYGDPNIACTVIEAGGGGGTNRSVTANVGSIAANDYVMVGLIHTGSTLKMVYNGVVVGSTACAQAGLSSTGPWVMHYGWKGTNLSFAEGPGDCDIGDVIIYGDSAGLDFTDEELLAMYLQFRTIYTALPAP